MQTEAPGAAVMTLPPILCSVRLWGAPCQQAAAQARGRRQHAGTQLYTQTSVRPGSMKVLLPDIASPLVSPSCYNVAMQSQCCPRKAGWKGPGMNPSSEFSFCRLPCDLDLANLSEPHFSVGGGRVCIFYTENPRTRDFVTCPRSQK